MKKIIFCLCLLIFPISVMAANITIDKNTFDKDTKTLTLGGVANNSYDQILISLFDGKKLVAFKTAKVKNGKFQTDFKLNYTSEAELNIRLANEAATETVDSKIVILKNVDSKITSEKTTTTDTTKDDKTDNNIEKAEPVATYDNIIIYFVLGGFAIIGVVISCLIKKRKCIKTYR